MVAASCTGCGRTYSLPDTWAGQTFRCLGCGADVVAGPVGSRTDDPPKRPWDRPNSGAGASPPRRGGKSHRTPEEILTTNQYWYYRHGRGVSGLFVLAGIIFVLVGVVNGVGKSQPGDPPGFLWGLSVVFGLAGVISGMVAIRGNRTWIWLTCPFAIVFLLMFPIGTAIVANWIVVLPKYLAACDRIRQVRAE